MPAEVSRDRLLAELLDPSRIVLFDGAMGTMLYGKGVFINQCYDELSVRSSDLVIEVHRAYVKAGAQVIETNTFGANRIKLAQYGLDKQVRDINEAGARLARSRTGGSGFRRLYDDVARGLRPSRRIQHGL